MRGLEESHLLLDVRRDHTQRVIIGSLCARLELGVWAAHSSYAASACCLGRKTAPARVKLAVLSAKVPVLRVLSRLAACESTPVAFGAISARGVAPLTSSAPLQHAARRNNITDVAPPSPFVSLVAMLAEWVLALAVWCAMAGVWRLLSTRVAPARASVGKSAVFQGNMLSTRGRYDDLRQKRDHPSALRETARARSFIAAIDRVLQMQPGLAKLTVRLPRAKAMILT